MSPGLYRLLSGGLSPFAGPLLSWRATRGKEDADRLGERLGFASSPRPKGPLIWLHGASVGETALALELWRGISAVAPGASALLTSGTRTSAGLAANRLPIGALHQYVPLDTPAATRRFLDHWRPSLGVFVESELWPNLLLGAGALGVPLALVNARLSARSLKRWKRMARFARSVLGCFQTIHVADKDTAAGLAELGIESRHPVFNLKLATAAPAPAPAELATLRRNLVGRQTWLAASTHPGEEKIMLQAHELVRKQRPDALLILAPRHPERGDEVSRIAAGAPRRALGNSPQEGPVYVADTIGELALFLAVSSLAFVGASLHTDGRGHNPCEAIAAGCPVASGRHVSSFRDIYTALDEASGIHWIDNADDLAAKVLQAFDEPEALLACTSRGQAVLEQARQNAQALIPHLLHLNPAFGDASASA